MLIPAAALFQKSAKNPQITQVAELPIAD